MPRTKVQKQTSKRNRNSDEDGLKLQLKEMQRIHDEFESDSTMIWQQRKEEVSDLFQKFRCSIGPAELQVTMGELISRESNGTDSLLTEINGSVGSKIDDDGYVTESSGRSSKMKKSLTADQKKRHRRSQSANGTTNMSTMSARPLSRINSMNDRLSRSKFRTPGNRLQTMSADRGVMNPVTPKIQMNTPVSLLRYPKVGETIISMSGSPVIVNGGTQHGIANINIPIKDGMFSMQPNAISDVDSELVSRIDRSTIRQLKQLQANLAFVMNTIKNKK